MPTGPARERVAWHLWCAFVVATASGVFVGTALGRTGGVWPAPLDDTYIYFGCARSFALGHPFAWYPGNGYGSGCTSTVYPMLLAPLWAVGLRGPLLGIGATLLAMLCLFDLARSLRRVGGEHPSSWLFPPLLVAIPLLSWSWLAGMETALLGAFVGRSVLSAHRAIGARDPRGDQLRTGAWLALAALTRPETVPFIAALAVALAYHGGALGALGSLARAGGPAFAVLGAQAAANRLLTGEWAQAGGIRKALWSSPYADPPQIALEWLKNLVVLIDQALVRGLGGTWLALALPLLSLAAALTRRHRPLALATLAGSLGALVLVCLNNTARYQNYRYAAPTLALLVLSAALGLDALARTRAWPLGALLAALGVLGPARQLRLQVEHFAQASANIVDQHVAVASRLRAMQPPPRRVLVNDAGAIPYLAELPPIDGLGLGAFRGLPFARASVHGQPAVVELIERLEPAARPDVMALYPSWWGDVVTPFGRRVDAVRIENNVICGAAEKVLYAADWSLLASPTDPPVAGAVDTLDVADLVSERDHDFELPRPNGGWVVGAVHRDESGRERYDAGRILPAARRVSFRVRAEIGGGPATLRARLDGDAPLRAQIRRDGVVIGEALAVPVVRGGGWRPVEARLESVAGGDRVELWSPSGTRLHHVWLIRP